MKRYYIVFSGIVQGVGFRWTLMNIAGKHRITGYCRNLSNGNVEAEIQGEEEDLTAFLKECFRPQRFIKIYDYAIKEKPLKEGEEGFTPVYY